MRSRLIPLAGVLALGAFAPAALADTTVSAYGTGIATVSPTNPKDEASIRAALDDANTRSYPLAFADAKAHAGLLADAASLTLGAVTIVAQQGPGLGPFYYGGFGGFAFGSGTAIGPFNGNFCGTVSRAIFKKVNGKRKVVRRVKERKCFFPTSVATTVELTFAALPKV